MLPPWLHSTWGQGRGDRRGGVSGRGHRRDSVSSPGITGGPSECVQRGLALSREMLQCLPHPMPPTRESLVTRCWAITTCLTLPMPGEGHRAIPDGWEWGAGSAMGSLGCSQGAMLAMKEERSCRYSSVPAHRKPTSGSPPPSPRSCVACCLPPVTAARSSPEPPPHLAPCFPTPALVRDDTHSTTHDNGSFCKVRMEPHFPLGAWQP